MPVVVVCPARCGSTTISEYLIEKGINMGERFSQEPGCWHENGGREDMDFSIPNQLLIQNAITIAQWKLLINHAFENRKEPWGVKDPRISALIREYKLFFPTALWIRPKRSIEDMAQSLVNKADWPMDKARVFVKRRTALLNRHLPSANVIQFESIEDGSYKGIIDGLLSNYYRDPCSQTK